MSIKQTKFQVVSRHIFPSGCVLITLRPLDGTQLSDCCPGQFIQVKADCANAMLRRPISICDIKDGHLTLFVKPVGPGSKFIASRSVGEIIDAILPLGHGFTVNNIARGEKILLVGGGVGAAPLVLLSHRLAEAGADVCIALGGRSHTDIEQLDTLYSTAARFAFSTDDGTLSEKGVITQNSVFQQPYDKIYCCGPTPMMRAVARIAFDKNIWCEVSLENHMACGLGACLCCVQQTSDSGNVCVCTEGPVFNINRLKSWI